jgi:GTPase SAR1 family protein
MLNKKLATIQAIGKIEEYLTDISNLKQTLVRAPLWRPAAGLKKQCDEATDMISKMAARMERKLVVTLIGPCGSGKSTLLNALAGQDDLSSVSNRRPTTQHVVTFCQQVEDADHLMAQLGPQNVILHGALEAQRLENLIIIDTPDTDSTHQERHIPIIEKAVLFSDVLLCVFDAENPKRRDHADFMAKQVNYFNGDSLVVLLNKCDRMDGRELSEKIMPDFEAFLKTAWNRPLTKILCTSGRSNLKDPKWDPKALPRNDLDQFKTLQELLFETFSRSGFGIDRRLENARTIRDFIVSKVVSAAKKDAEDLSHLLIRMKESEQGALKQALQTFGNDEERQVLGINVMLYQKLAQRWLGPVGWLVALWGRILVFGLGFTAMLRFGNPMRQIWGMAATLRHYKEAKGAMDISQQGEDLEDALFNYKSALMQSWPDIAEALVAQHMDNKVRNIAEILPDSKQLEENLSKLWQKAIQLEVQKSSDSLSHFFLQILFNLPVVGILGYTGWLTATHFLTGHYLSSDFFVHALLTILFVLLLSFFLLQVIIRLSSGRDRIHGRAFHAVQKRLKNYGSLSDSPLAQQLALIVGLGQKTYGE